MKSVAFLVALSVAELHHALGVVAPLRQNISSHPSLRLSQNTPDKLFKHSESTYGDPACQCVGIDNMRGEAEADLDGGKVTYAAEAGASCGTWDKEHHHACSGASPPDWCAKRWCFVDPCKCNIEVVPKITRTGWLYQGKPAYWSYATCGAKDTYSMGMAKGSCQNHRSQKDCEKGSDCAWNAKAMQCVQNELLEHCSKEVDEAVYGQASCPCIGFSNREGWTEINDGTKEANMIKYPVDAGSTCGSWEKDVHPACNVDASSNTVKPAWCTQSWCWVDPCNCKAKVVGCGESGSSTCFVPPKVSSNKELKSQGRDVYFSYETCGSGDSWTAGHREQYCVAQRTPEDCKKLGDRCVWTGLECIGKDLAEKCSGATGLRPFATLVTLVLCIVMSRK